MDFRKGADGFAVLVRESLGADPFSGTVYVFRARRADRVKLFYIDGTSVCLLSKRQDANTFHPTRRDEAALPPIVALLS